MKKLLFIGFILIGTVSCTKEAGFSLGNKIGQRCNDGSITGSLNPGACGEYTLTELKQVLVAGQWINYTQVTKKTHGGFKEFIYGKKTFCEIYSNHLECLGRNY